jgi:hypothetical protein
MPRFSPSLTVAAVAICLLAVTPATASAATVPAPRATPAGRSQVTVATFTCTSTVATSYGGAPVTISIPKAGDEACVTFSGETADVEFTDIAQKSGHVSPFLDIFNPSGTSVCAGPYSNPGGCPIGASGTWTLQITDTEGTHTGALYVGIQRLDSAAKCKSISFGTKTVTGDIKTPASTTCYTFKGTSGEIVYIHEAAVKGTVGTPEITLGAPDGSQPCSNGEITLDCPLTETGTDSVLFYASSPDTGTFNLSMQLLTKPVGCPTLKKNGPSIASEVQTLGQVRCFTFAGKKSEAVTLSLSSITGTLNPLMDLFSPSGVSTLAGPGKTIIDNDLSATGSWLMLIEDSSGSGTGNFDIALT